MNETFAESQLPLATPASRGAFTGLAALGAVFALPTAVDAAIVYSGLQNLTVTLPPAQRHASNATAGTDNANVALDVDGNAVNDFNLHVRQRRTGAGFGSGTAFLSPLVGGNMVQGGEGGAYNLRTSNNVPVPHPYNTGLLRRRPPSVFGSGYFANGVAGVAGVSFQEGGQNHFGWVRLRVDDGPSGFPAQLTAIDWAWESTANTPIHIENPVPEANPGMVLLAAGGTGLAAWRLRKRKQAKAATTA